MSGVEVRPGCSPGGCTTALLVTAAICLASVSVYFGWQNRDRLLGGQQAPTPTGLVMPTGTSTLTVTPSPEASPTVGALSSVDALIAQACRTQYARETGGNYNQYLVTIPRPEDYKNLVAADQESAAIVNWYRNVLDVAKAKNIFSDPIVNYLKQLGITEKNKFDLVTPEDLFTKDWAKNAKWIMFSSEAGSLSTKVDKLVDDMITYYAKQGKTIDKATYKASLLKSAQITFDPKQNPNAFMSMPVWYVYGNVEGSKVMDFSYNVKYGEDKYPNGPLAAQDRVVIVLPNETNPTNNVKARAVVLDDFSRKIKVDVDKDGKFEDNENFWCDGSGNKGGGWPTLTPTGTVVTTITPTATETPHGPPPPPPTETPQPPETPQRGTATPQPPRSVPTSTSQPIPVTPETGPATSTPVFVASPVPTKRPEATVPPATVQPTDMPDNIAPTARPTAPVTSQSDERYLSLVGPYLTHEQWKNGGAEAFANSVMALLGENK